jgi:hypothetical protein
MTNATFHTFKASGKWYTSERGTLTPDCYGEPFTPIERRKRIIQANGGKCPGLSHIGSEFVLVIIPDESVDFGFPLMLPPGANE